MRNPTPFDFLNDLSRELLDGGGLGACPPDGLCRPADSLDKVIGYVSTLGDGFFEDLGLDWPLPGSRVDDDDTVRAQEDVKPDAGALAAAPCEAGGPGGRKSGACHVFDSVPEGLPALPFSCTPTPPGSRSLSPPTGVAEPQGLLATSQQDGLRWTVLNKPHNPRVVARRRLPAWSLALPTALMSPAAHDADYDANDKDFELMSCRRSNGLPRPAGAGQKRQRKRGTINGTEKTCTHCRASDTPQWRAGPAGNGTLCNACGIRYKMGRLFPEYRPSNSPEFRSSEHSNRHRNVERIRQRKKLKVMAPQVQVPLNPDADRKLLLPLPVCKYET